MIRNYSWAFANLLIHETIEAVDVIRWFLGIVVEFLFIIRHWRSWEKACAKADYLESFQRHINNVITEIVCRNKSFDWNNGQVFITLYYSYCLSHQVWDFSMCVGIWPWLFNESSSWRKLRTELNDSFRQTKMNHCLFEIVKVTSSNYCEVVQSVVTQLYHATVKHESLAQKLPSSICFRENLLYRTRRQRSRNTSIGTKFNWKCWKRIFRCDCFFFIRKWYEVKTAHPTIVIWSYEVSSLALLLPTSK
jgi:hypothetical protein